VLPGGEVSPNETWKRTSKLTMGPIGSYDNTYNYTFKGKEKDSKLDKIEVKTDLKYTPPNPDAQGGALPFKIKKADLSSKNATGTILVDADKGRVEKSEMTLELSGNLDIEISGQTASVSLTQNQTTKVETSDINPIAKKS
jgi:hypothetical protein